MRAIAIVAVMLVAGCHPRRDREDQCHDVVDHMRKVSAMPMRDGDVMMFMGACQMWKQSTLDCMAKAPDDPGIKWCRDMEPGPAAAAPPAPATRGSSSYLDYRGRDDMLSGGSKMIPIKTAAGTFNVWTKRTGNNPRIKVLLLHGGPGATHEYMEAFDSYFPEAGVEYYFYDQLESGWSDRPDKPALWDPARFVDEVEQIRQALHLDKDNFYLLGHSWGGIVALEYALAHQDHLKGLVISNMMSSAPAYNKYAHDVLMPQMDQTVLAEILKLEQAKQYDLPRYEELLMPSYYSQHILRMPPEKWPDPVVRAFAHLNKKIYVAMQGPSEMGLSGRLTSWDRTADLPRITVPTLVIGAKYDTMDPAFMESMSKQVKHGRYLYCPAGTHLAMYDDQQTYMNGVLDFLRDVDGGKF
jgi:proline iminopeptidase